MTIAFAGDVAWDAATWVVRRFCDDARAHLDQVPALAPAIEDCLESQIYSVRLVDASPEVLRQARDLARWVLTASIGSMGRSFSDLDAFTVYLEKLRDLERLATQALARVDRPSASRPMFELEPDEALRHHLPAIGLRVESAGLAVRPFPEPNAYLTLQGPPDVPVAIFFFAAPEPSSAEGAIERAVRASFHRPEDEPLLLDGPDALAIDGARRSGLTFFTGLGSQRMGWFAAVLDHPRGQILAALGLDVGDVVHVDAATIAMHPAIAQVIESLTLV